MTKGTHFDIFSRVKCFNWNPEKNEELKRTRGRSFEEVVFFIEKGGLIDDIIHPQSDRYPSQRILVVAILDYVYLVPYVESEEEVFLKTIIPSRKFTKLYLKEPS